MTRRTGYRKDSANILPQDALERLIQAHAKGELTWAELATRAGVSDGHLTNRLHTHRRDARAELAAMFRQERPVAEISAAFDRYLASY